MGMNISGQAVMIVRRRNACVYLSVYGVWMCNGVCAQCVLCACYFLCLL